jgi:hypothetical protein
LRFAVGQSIKGCGRKIWVRLKADSVRVVLSKEVSLLEFYDLTISKRSAAWNFFDLKEFHKVVLSWPYSAHVSYQRWQLHQIMIGDGREPE